MKRLFFLMVFVVQSSLACPVGQSGPSPSEQKKERKEAQELREKEAQELRKRGYGRKIASDQSIPLLPSASSARPWGGKDKKKWRPEAILANAVSRALNKAWKKPEVVDVIVSVPVKMIPTKERPYGDGQTNASVAFGPDWMSREPQLVTSLLRFKNGQRFMEILFSRSVTIKESKVTVKMFAGSNKDELVNLTLDRSGYHGTWKVPEDIEFGDLTGSKVIWIHPLGWDAAFPIDFRFPIYQNGNLLASSSSAQTSGQLPLDPMGILAKSKNSGRLAQDLLKETVFGPEWIKNNNGGDYFTVDNIHGEVPGPTGQMKTAVGGGLTWVIGRGLGSTFKNLYTCFDPRNFVQESIHGVPSGGGWHEIGDAAETIINAVELAPVGVGFATGLPSQTPPNSLKFAWGLSDVASVRFLMPGEGMMTAAGDITWKEDEEARPNSDWSKSVRPRDQSGRGRNYHWFFFQSDQPICTQEWVHNCRPLKDNNFGLEQKKGSDCNPAM
jgi:hypothetical protein